MNWLNEHKAGSRPRQAAAARAEPARYFPVDVRFYTGQPGFSRLKTGLNPAAGKPACRRHFLEIGSGAGLDPTPYFCSRWYQWQNPDWAGDGAATPYGHYLQTGRYQGRAPSALVDMQRFHMVTGGRIRRRDAYQRILDGLRAPALGVYQSYGDLEPLQKLFLKNFAPTAVRIRKPGSGRRNLVFLQCGGGSVHRRWYQPGAQRNWDLLVNAYGQDGFCAGFGDHVFLQYGSKFSAMANLWECQRDLLMSYDHILFLDDDIEVSGDGLNQLFTLCRDHRLDLAQMSLLPGSFCVWKDLFQQPTGKACRPLNAVEIMMPVLSRRALELVGPELHKSVSGFGLDLLWGARVRQNGGKVAVTDRISARHDQAIDDLGGTYTKGVDF